MKSNFIVATTEKLVGTKTEGRDFTCPALPALENTSSTSRYCFAAGNSTLGTCRAGAGASK